MNANRQPRSASSASHDRRLAHHGARRRPPGPARRRGIALILVLLVVGIATIVSLAMLSNATLNAQVAGSSSAVCEADTLAESGVSIAEYYLMHPEKAPSLTTDGYWAGQLSASTLGFSGGTLTQITVFANSQPGPTTRRFDITSTASASVPGAAGKTVSRTTKATVDVQGKYLFKYALAANGNLTVPATWTMNVTGDTRIDGTYTSFSVLNLVGSLFSRDAGNSNAPPTYPTQAAPTLGQIGIVQSRPSYTYQGHVYQAEALGSGTYSSSQLKTGNATANPGNVWYATGSRAFASTVSIPGTLIIVGSTSNLKIAGTVTITPKSGLPGLIVEKDVQFSGLLKKLRVDGLMWVGGNVTTDGFPATGTLEVYGSMMFGSTNASFGSGLTGSATIQFNGANVNNLPPDFATTNQTPQSLKRQTWTQ